MNPALLLWWVRQAYWENPQWTPSCGFLSIFFTRGTWRSMPPGREGRTRTTWPTMNSSPEPPHNAHAKTEKGGTESELQLQLMLCICREKQNTNIFLKRIIRNVTSWQQYIYAGQLYYSLHDRRENYLMKTIFINDLVGAWMFLAMNASIKNKPAIHCDVYQPTVLLHFHRGKCGWLN